MYNFVNYGEVLNPAKGSLVLDVGMKTVPGVIDHHHPRAEMECTASLIAKYPHLVLDHIKIEDTESQNIKIITHRLPDFDAVSSIFLALMLIEIKRIDLSMEKIAHYTRMVDSASLPKEIDLPSTPYSILRALFNKIKKREDETNHERVREGLKFMNFLYTKSEEGYEIFHNRTLFSGIERYEKAMRRAEDDYFNYLSDLKRGQKISLYLPLVSGHGKKKVDVLITKNPKSFLLKEWARRDRENSSLNEGFGLTVTNFGDKRYILGVDPEKGVNLRKLGNLLNEKESKKREVMNKPFEFSWYDGNCPFFNFRIIDSPQDGTVLSSYEVIDGLLFFSQNLE
ncbi:MAG: hypothetical protein ACETWK_06725 [Candidatus Aminicenantaceae bacterium]